MRIPRSPYHCCTSRRWPAADERASDKARERVPHVGVSRRRTSKNDPLAANARERREPSPWVAHAVTTAASFA